MNESPTREASSILLRAIQKPIRRIYLGVRNEIMARSGLQPRGVYWYSRSGHVFEDAISHRMAVPNIVGYYHHAMAQFIRVHGLGKKCLLVSESKSVKQAMSKIHPNVEFVSCDLFPELMNRAPYSNGTDMLWDVCLEPPSGLRSGFSSVICQALLEHVIDPTNALKNMLRLLGGAGKLYFMTHTPSFSKHQMPRDYCRFHHDYFQDLPAYYAKSGHLTITLEELYSKEGVIVGCYFKT
jgi:SAM-dependent methyltransferase